MDKKEFLKDQNSKTQKTNMKRVQVLMEHIIKLSRAHPNTTRGEEETVNEVHLLLSCSVLLNRQGRGCRALVKQDKALVLSAR